MVMADRMLQMRCSARTRAEARPAHPRGRAPAGHRRHERHRPGDRRRGRAPGRAGRGGRALDGPRRPRLRRGRGRIADAAASAWAAWTTSCARPASCASGRWRRRPAAELAEVIDVNLTGTPQRRPRRVPASARDAGLVHRLRVELVHARAAGLRRLLGEQGRRGQPDPGPRRGVGGRRHPRQRRQPGADRHADAPHGPSRTRTPSGCWAPTTSRGATLRLIGSDLTGQVLDVQRHDVAAAGPRP